jgi:hypothetical protein
VTTPLKKVGINVAIYVGRVSFSDRAISLKDFWKPETRLRDIGKIKKLQSDLQMLPVGKKKHFLYHFLVIVLEGGTQSDTK